MQQVPPKEKAPAEMTDKELHDCFVWAEKEIFEYKEFSRVIQNEMIERE